MSFCPFSIAIVLSIIPCSIYDFWEFFIEIDFFCVSKLSIDLFFKLPMSRFLAINIEGKIGHLTVRRTSSFIIELLQKEKFVNKGCIRKQKGIQFKVVFSKLTIIFTLITFYSKVTELK
jgi:hypothetical protein